MPDEQTLHTPEHPVRLVTTSVTSAVDRLERQGFVRRRATLGLNTLFADPGLPPGEVAQLTALLRRLRAGAGDEVDASS